MGEDLSAQQSQLGHQGKVAQRPFNFKTGMSQGLELGQTGRGGLHPGLGMMRDHHQAINTLQITGL